MRFRRQSGGSYLIVIALLCILSMLYPSSKIVSQFQVRSIDNGHSKSKFPPKHGLAITMAVNYKAGPIGAKKVVKPSLKYIKSWYRSIHRIRGIKGLVIENMFHWWLRAVYSDSKVSFFHFHPDTHRSFVQTPQASNRSINDQRFFVIEWLLNQTELVEPYNYIILSDGRDVEFLHNPIPFFEATDEAAGTPQLYVQTEAAPSKGNLGWMNNVWKRCFGRKYPDSQHFYNAGIIAGSKDKLKDLLRHMNEMFLTLDPQHNCNMAVLQRVIM